MHAASRSRGGVPFPLSPRKSVFGGCHVSMIASRESSIVFFFCEAKCTLPAACFLEEICTRIVPRYRIYCSWWKVLILVFVCVMKRCKWLFFSLVNQSRLWESIEQSRNEHDTMRRRNIDEDQQAQVQILESGYKGARAADHFRHSFSLVIPVFPFDHHSM